MELKICLPSIFTYNSVIAVLQILDLCIFGFIKLTIRLIQVWIKEWGQRGLNGMSQLHTFASLNMHGLSVLQVKLSIDIY